MIEFLRRWLKDWMLWVIGRRPISRGTNSFHWKHFNSIRLPWAFNKTTAGSQERRQATPFFIELINWGMELEWKREQKDGRNVVNWMSEMGWKPITNNAEIKKDLSFLLQRQLTIHSFFHSSIHSNKSKTFIFFHSGINHSWIDEGERKYIITVIYMKRKRVADI